MRFKVEVYEKKITKILDLQVDSPCGSIVGFKGQILVDFQLEIMNSSSVLGFVGVGEVMMI